MIKTLEIKETLPTSARQSWHNSIFYIYNNIYTMIESGMTPIKAFNLYVGSKQYDVITWYTERPDGTWYRLTLDVDKGPYRTLIKMLREGMEPYLAFEIIAL